MKNNSKDLSDLPVRHPNYTSSPPTTGTRRGSNYIDDCLQYYLVGSVYYYNRKPPGSNRAKRHCGRGNSRRKISN